MGSFLATRLVYGAISVFAATVVVFILTHLSGDPAVLMLPSDASRAEIEAFRVQQGWDDPLPVQYVRFLRGAVQGDFGTSLRHGDPALELVLQHFPATLQLTAAALLLTVIISVPLGVIAAYRRGTWIDFSSLFFAAFGQATPNFWLGIMLVYLLAVQLPIFPTSGRGTILHLVLPSICLSLTVMAMLTRLTRTTMLEVLNEDFIRTARGKGLAERTVLQKHALSNVMIPVITVIGLRAGYLLGGAVVIETVFAWPGVGFFTLQAIRNADFPVVQAAVFTLAVAIIIINLIADMLYAVFDPRIRYGQ